jgi:hypothetical protein
MALFKRLCCRARPVTSCRLRVVRGSVRPCVPEPAGSVSVESAHVLWSPRFRAVIDPYGTPAQLLPRCVFPYARPNGATLPNS